MGVFLYLSIFLVYAVAHESSDAGFHCCDNPLCNCTRFTDNSFKLDCSGLHLNQCPYIYGNVSFVDLSRNNISEFNDCVLPSSVLHLDIAHNIISSTDSISFKNLSKLETLNISFNKIRYLDKSSFRFARNIRYLDVSNCDLRSVMSGTFRPLTQLSYLNISFNKRLTFRPLENITYDLKFTKIEVLDISKLHCTYGPGIVVFIEDILYLNESRLQTLHVNSNRISEIEGHALKYLPPTLERVFIKDNVLSIGSYAVEVSFLTSLKSIDASFQNAFHSPTINTNKYYSCNDWRPPKHVGIRLDGQHEEKESYVNLSDVEPMPMNFPFPLPRNLEIVTFKGCNVKTEIRENVFTENSLKRLTLHGNTFYSFVGPVENLHQLEYLDLSNNFCSYISEYFLSDVPNLITLNISNNLLGSALNDVNPFQYLQQLKILDLSSNRIECLKRDLFEQTFNISILILRLNAMTTWNFTIQQMTKLRYIDLSNNNIQFIPENVRAEITHAANTRNLSINLENNLMNCDCKKSFLDHLKWMRDIQRLHGVFVKFETYTMSCMSVIGQFLLADDEAVEQFEMHCNSYIGIIFGVLGAIMMIVCVLICGLIYRFRWKLRYLFYMKKNKYRERHSNQGNDRTYKFDAFVSYSDEDSSFIREQVINELEMKRDFSLCLHQRDFTLGKYVEENITDAIHRSRVTVAVITPSYLKSYWCMFEFNMARMESVYAREGDNTIFLLLYKPVPMKTLPLTMLDLIDNKTYIEYPEEEIEGNVMFWDGIARGINL